MERTITDFKIRIIEALAGKLNLSQDYGERKRLVCEAFLELAKIPEEKGLIKKVGFSADMDSAQAFAEDFLSFDVIAEFLKNPDVEDVVIDGLKPVFIHSSKDGFVKTDKKFDNSKDLEMFVKKLIIFSGRNNINNIGEILNLELPDNSGRVNIVHSPFGPQLTITRAKLIPLSIIDLIERQALSYELAAQLWLYVEGMSIKPANIIIAGGPGAGKTTLLNAILAFIPPRDRLVVIEDTLELNTAAQTECSRLESDDSVNLADLVKNSLRMRPDRIIIGEVRGSEAKDLMTAMNVGRYCMGTLHASTAREAIIRLQNEPMNAPSVLINLVDVFVIMKKFDSGGIIRRAISELVETAGLEQKEVLICPVWKYDSETGKFLELGPGPYRDHLAKARGIYPTEVIKEVKQRADILRRLKTLNKDSYKDVAEFCGLYCTDKKKAMSELKM